MKAFLSLLLSLSTGTARAIPFSQSGALAPPTSVASDYFGYSLATTTTDNCLVWVASGAPTAGAGGGTAHVLTYLFPASSSGNSLSYLGQLTPSPAPVAGDAFGTDISMSADGTVIAVGAPSAAPNKGSITVFAGARAPGQTSLKHTQLQALVPTDAAAGDQFGSSVALSGSGAVLVGCSSSATVDSLANAGACYVYVRSAAAPFTYALAATLKSPNPRAGGYFGGQDGSVGVSQTGLVVAIGEPAVSPVGATFGSGTVYIFTASDTTWATVANAEQLAPATSLSGNLYGWMVAVNPAGTVIAAGAAGDTVGTKTTAGSTTVWRKGATAWTRTLVTATNGATGDAFGSGLALSSDGSVLAVGAYNGNGTAGRAYTYTASGSAWLEETPVLSASYASAGAGFGYNVRLSSDAASVFVSGYLAQVNGGGAQTGLAYAFSRGLGGACQAPPPSLLSLGGPIGGAVGGAAVLAIAGFVVYKCCCKRASKPVLASSPPAAAAV